MLFNSYIFIGFFLPVVLMGFGLACRLGRTAAVGWLVVASLVFYSWWNAAFLPVLLVSIAGNFLAARLILATQGRLRAAVLWAAIAANLGGLGFYKYLWFLQGTPMTPIPLGISFFTFTQIGYLLDCHADMETRRPPLDYALFVTFFPHLIAGPILTSREILPAFANPATWRLSADNIGMGGTIFLIGLLKKTLLADPIAALAAPGFAAPETLSLFPSWSSALAWSLQLYFDFSGYSDMAVGLARMFGIAFPFNFDAPYRARSVIDYWQRWHISLTRFLMSTIHAPLTLSIMRRRRARRLSGQNSLAGFAALVALPIMTTMGLAGIWHGAGLTFLVFGLLHGTFLVINHAWRLWGPVTFEDTPTDIVITWTLTYVSVLIGAVIFRAPSMDIALSLFAGMAGRHGIDWSFDPRGLMDAAWLAGLYLIVLCAPTTQTLIQPETWRPTRPLAAAAGIAAALGLLSIGGTGEFLYFQF